ncbi:glycoside hydrolase family protein [Ottowia testudinis]|uniref:Lysozyme n=1 Tax=Ottowia testudinis TaxID=2816950 RepID=A0A975CIC2_9BURK|nr:LysM peptidoglycan-binding domain-containing protein [Ottowia testudinis]QTD45487.1 LysM peptidoglycan-binding domain-containing protein [Ottowia testudinis]
MTAISSALAAGAASRPAGGQSVTAERGDSLSAIASRHGVPLQSLIAANPQIANPNRIYPGDTITVPGGMGGAAPASNSPQAAAPGAGAQQPSQMKLSQDGLNMVKKYEGLFTKAYVCPAGVLTIGYGHTGAGVKPGQRITEAQAEQLLRQDMGKFEAAVQRQVKVPLTQGQFDALTSFTFNCGEGALKNSTLLKKLNAGDYAGAQAEFHKWNKGGGRVLPGLVKRRAEEAQMFGHAAPSGASAPTSASQALRNAAGAASARTHTVRAGDTLWDIARANGVSLQNLIAANPQIKNPNLIHAGQKVNIPGQTGGPTGPAPAPGGNASGARTARIAESFLNRNASELKKSGQLPMNPNVPSNLCCANFVSAVLQKNGLLSNGEHTDSVAQLDKTLRGKGWRPVSMAHAKPGDVVIMQRGGVSHTEIVAKNENGKITLIGSNNRNADGSQRITYDAGPWWQSKVSGILTPP